MKNKIDKKLESMLSQIVFIPESEHLRIKSAFYTVFDENPVCDSEDITAAQIAQITKSPKIFEYWHLPGFKQWFQNSNELKQQINYLLYDCVKTAHEIIKDPEQNPNARIKAIELMFKIADKMPKQYGKVEYRDKQIGQMNEEQLKEFIKKSNYLLETSHDEVNETETEDTEGTDG